MVSDNDSLFDTGKYYSLTKHHSIQDKCPLVCTLYSDMGRFQCREHSQFTNTFSSTCTLINSYYKIECLLLVSKL